MTILSYNIKVRQEECGHDTMNISNEIPGLVKHLVKLEIVLITCQYFYRSVLYLIIKSVDNSREMFIFMECYT